MGDFKETAHKFHGCLFVGRLDKAGAINVKSPYNSDQELALNEYNKKLRNEYAEGNVSERLRFKQLIAKDRKIKAAWVKKLKKTSSYRFQKEA